MMQSGAKDEGRRAYLRYRAECELAFNPFAPIDLPDFFAGRHRHIERLETEIEAPGRHVAVFGERGVGKTSLARLAYFFLNRDEEESHFVRCQSDSTFDSIFIEVFESAGIELFLNGMESHQEVKGALNLKPLSAGGARGTKRTFRRLAPTRGISSRLLLEHFASRRGLIIIDEFDRVQDPQTHTKMAELIKHFSDARSETKIIVVGVAETVSELIGEHESLGRSLAQIKLDRMSDEELLDIIQCGEDHLKAAFKEPVKHRIIRLADGFPYFVHLLSRHACLIAGRQLLKNPNAKAIIAEEEYRIGLSEALENAEHSLADQYQQAIVTTRRQSEMLELILWAMALSSEREVQVRCLAENVSFFTRKEYSSSAFSYHLGKLVKPERARVLTKIRDGYYKFTNPLMRPYVRFRLEFENVTKYGAQFEFPFMLDR